MLLGLFLFCVGLLVGWNLLPQPMWVKALWDKVANKFKKDAEKKISGGCCGP